MICIMICIMQIIKTRNFHFEFFIRKLFYNQLKTSAQWQLTARQSLYFNFITVRLYFLPQILFSSITNCKRKETIKIVWITVICFWNINTLVTSMMLIYTWGCCRDSKELKSSSIRIVHKIALIIHYKIKLQMKISWSETIKNQENE